MANTPNYQPLLTRDTDLAFANRAPLAGDIKSALAQAGFIEEFSGTHQPPVTRYTLGDDDAGFYAEFLTPLTGSETRRDGTADATMTKAGITTQKLRHLDILLLDMSSHRKSLVQGSHVAPIAVFDCKKRGQVSSSASAGRQVSILSLYSEVRCSLMPRVRP